MKFLKNPISCLTTVIILLNLSSGHVLAQTPCNTNSPKTYILSETSLNEIYIPDASTRPWKGGDTLKIPAKTYSLIEISNFSGDACKKIVIINSGGQVITNTWRMRNDSRYFKITGTGKAGLEYGIKISGGMLAISLAHDFEIDHVECTGGSLGFYIKTTPDRISPKTVYTTGSSSNYVMSNIYLHHNYFHEISGEAMYVGHTGPSGNQEGTGLIPIRLDNVEIAYNTYRNIDWDAIQLSNARNNAKIHHNTIWNFGRINKGAQQAGIILGGNTSGDVYNNTISKGTGTGMQIFGYGTIRIYNNFIDSTGNDFSTTGQESFYANDNITLPESNPKQQILFYNNIVRNPMPKGAVRVTWYTNNSLPATINDNQFYIPNAASNWLTFHVVANPPGSIKYNNVLIGSNGFPNQLPIAIAGADATITLPVNSVSLSGSGTDNDGIITAYSWTKSSGPAAVISTPTNANTTITSLTPGEYIFELKVTDNEGGTAKDNILVIVYEAPVSGGSGKTIKVNITKGTDYNSSQWNNWNTLSSLTSARFNFDDAAVSNIYAVLNSQGLVVDNGSTYALPATLPPSAVLRFNSASTSTRSLTIKGLDRSKKYNFEFFGSRSTTGNKSVFNIGSKKDTINTDNNISDIARLYNITPDNSGNAVITIIRIGTWNYLAGFSITEQSSSAREAGNTETTESGLMISETDSSADNTFVTVFPNPFTTKVQVHVNNKLEGDYQIILSDISGKEFWNKSNKKGLKDITETIDTRVLKNGNYIIKVTTKEGTSVHNVSKKIMSIEL